jgi:hypothetical protein
MFSSNYQDLKLTSDLIHTLCGVQWFITTCWFLCIVYSYKISSNSSHLIFSTINAMHTTLPVSPVQHTTPSPVVLLNQSGKWDEQWRIIGVGPQCRRRNWRLRWCTDTGQGRQAACRLDVSLLIREVLHIMRFLVMNCCGTVKSFFFSCVFVTQ